MADEVRGVKPGIAEVLARREHDFVDFGCSAGNSMVFATRTLKGGRGFGIDIDAAKVETARQAGHEAYVADARTLLDAPDSVRFAVMSHFLEHLPAYSDAVTCIRSAAAVSRDFVFIRQPWFDADGYLLGLGLKLYWSDWTGHTNQMSTLEMYRALSAADGIAEFAIFGHRRIADSASPDIHSLASPRNAQAWNADEFPSKPAVAFTQPVYRELIAVAIKKGSNASLDHIARRVTREEPVAHVRHGAPVSVAPVRMEPATPR